MKYLSIIADIMHWLAIVIVAGLTLYLLFDPNRNGGDAATRGLGNAFVYIGIILLIFLIILKMLPYDWPKYVVIVVILLPFLLIKFDSVYKKLTYKWQNEAIFKENEAHAAGKHLFNDPQQLALIKAARENDTLTAAKLLSQPFPLLNDYNNAAKQTVLDFICNDERHIPTIKLLLQAGAQLEIKDPNKETTLLHNAQDCSPQMLDFLLQQGSNPNYVHQNANAAIFEVLDNVLDRAETLQKVKLLVQYHADPNLQVTFNGNYKNYTPLMWAAANHYTEVCEWLIQNGADPNYINPDGYSYQSILEANNPN